MGPVTLGTSLNLLKKLFNRNLFISCSGSLLLYGLFSSCGELRLLSSCGAQASHCGGFSRCGAEALGAWGSVVVAPGL